MMNKFGCFGKGNLTKEIALGSENVSPFDSGVIKIFDCSCASIT
ncbi:hypothetical protein [Parendozoicomonas callyspongiae]|nr:hypothetical protein [Sansalvadorimonas sp. 2012CJ34-2]